MKPGKPVTLLHQSGMTLDGIYLGLDTTRSLLLFSRHRMLGIDTSRYHLSEISGIKYRKGGAKFGYLIAGAAAGLLVAAYVHSTELEDINKLDYYKSAAVWLGFVGSGIFVGMALASGSSKTVVTVNCNW